MAIHTKNILSYKSGNIVNLSSIKLVFTLEEKIYKAEVLQAMKCVISNHSIASAKNDLELFRSILK